MTTGEVHTLALAIAHANGHPDPEAWAALVMEHFPPEVAPSTASM